MVGMQFMGIILVPWEPRPVLSGGIRFSWEVPVWKMLNGVHSIFAHHELHKILTSLLSSSFGVRWFPASNVCNHLQQMLGRSSAVRQLRDNNRRLRVCQVPGLQVPRDKLRVVPWDGGCLPWQVPRGMSACKQCLALVCLDYQHHGIGVHSIL